MITKFKIFENNKFDNYDKLYYAIRDLNLQDVKKIINKVPDIINTRYEYVGISLYNTPLHIASELNGSSEIIIELLNNGADINAINDLGESPLIVASEYEGIGHFEIVKLLIENDADWNIKDENNNYFIDFLGYPSVNLDYIIKKYSEKYENFLIYKKSLKYNI